MGDALQISPAESLALTIQEKRKQRLGLLVKNWPRKNPVASDIGECDRQIVYSIQDWDKRLPHDENLQARFEVGNQREREIIRDLLDMGFEVIETQSSFEIKDKDGSVLISGKIDGKIKFGGNKVPFEIKSMNPLIFNQVDRLEDFFKKSHLRKYVRQMMVYLYANNEEMGLLLLDDCLGHWKIIPIGLDYDSTEVILRRLESIQAHLGKHTLPERVNYSSEICGRCPFKHICLPIEAIGDQGEIIDSPELAEKLTKRFALAPIVEEYTAIDKEVKEIFKIKPGQTIIGTPPQFVVTSKEQTRESYNYDMLPAETLEKIRKVAKFNVVKIERVES